MTRPLADLALEFTTDLNRTLAAVLAPGSDPVRVEATVVEPGFVYIQQIGVLQLCTSRGPLLDLEISIRCRRSRDDDFLAVLESKIRVTPAGQGEPLVRYEFIDEARTVPAAHVQVHGEHARWGQVYGALAGGSARARRNRRRGMISDLHFPVGGRRFRPCLEDVLEMLLTEFNVLPATSVEDALAVLREGRAKWRSNQLGASVSDNPRRAAAALRKLGYDVRWVQGGEEPDARRDRIEEL